MTRETLRSISPVDGSVYIERPLATDADVEAALDRAAAAHRHWRRVPVAARAAMCSGMAAWLVERADVLGEELTRQMGRPIAHTPTELRRGFAERVGYMTSIAESALSDVVPEPEPGYHRFIRREPIGVVVVVAPWNYPWLTSVNAVVPALLAGNVVILKMAQQTPLVAERYADAFAHAGLPKDVFQFLHMTHEQVAKTVADARVGHVAFTGSVPGGHAVQRAASERFVATGLELGGKDPAYVRPDAAVEATIENLVDGAFYNAGQSCCAVERIYVHGAVYDRFVEGYAALTEQYRLASPLEAATTLGPVVRVSAAQAVRDQVAEAVQRGAKALIDPSRYGADRPGTPYLAPQVLIDVDHSMQLMTEETFGPAIGIMRVRNDEEAIALMNDSRYGLTASIWTSDVDAAVSIGERIETGTWYMNRCDYLDPALAWTGVKDSGRGCTLSALGIQAFTRPKSYHLRLTL